MTGTAKDAYLIVKRGLYYRPDAKGYTGVKAEAGRYSKAEAEARAYPNGPDGPRDGMSFVHEDDAPEFSQACWEETKIATLSAQLETERRRSEGLRGAVTACSRFFKEAMPQMNVGASALDGNAIDAWNKAEIAVARATLQEDTE